MSADVPLSRETPDGDRLEFGPTATLVPRSRPPVSVPESSTQFYGYLEQSSRVAELAERGTPAIAGIWGHGGVGKTELLVRAIALARGDWPDGRVFLSVRDAAAEDVIALICDAVFEVDDARLRPSIDVCSAALAKCRLIVALDDLRSPADLGVLGAALANSLLFITTLRPWNVTGVEWIGLHGLTSHGVSVLRDAASNDVPGDLAVTLVHSLEGNPSRIARAARLGLPLETIAASCSSAKAFDELSLARLRETLSLHEQLALATAATFGVAGLGPHGPPVKLVQSGFLEYTPVGWAVPDGLRDTAAELEPDAGVLASKLLEALDAGGRSSFSAADLLAATPGLLGVVECDGVPASVAGRIVSSMLDRFGLWATSSELCEALRILARKLEDPGTWAWSMHQLGTRRACAGDGEAARALFAGALAARQFNADEPGCAVTVANLALLSGGAPRDAQAGSAAHDLVQQELVPPSSGPRPQPPRDGDVVPERYAAADPIPVVPPTAVRVVSPATGEPQPDVVLLPPEHEPGRVRQGPPRRRRERTPLAAAALGLGAVGVLVAVLLWVVMRQSDEQFASAGASPSPRATLQAPPGVRAPAALAAQRTILPAIKPRARASPLTTEKPQAAVTPSPAPVHTPFEPVKKRIARTAASRARHAREPLSPQKTPKPDRGQTRIDLLSLLPATVVPHQSATLCVSAVHADVVSVSGVGDVPAGETTCRVVSPGATTTYVARASNTAWRVTRSITLTVTPDGLP